MTDEDRKFAWIAGDGERKPLPRRIADWVGDRMDDIGAGLSMAFSTPSPSLFPSCSAW